MTLTEYVHSYGYKVSELSKEQLAEVKKELEATNNGTYVDDSCLLRRMKED